MSEKNTEPRLAIGTHIRMKEDYLQSFPPALRRAYTDRIGSVKGYRAGAIHPVLAFPKEGRRIERHLFEVEPRYFEVVPAP